MMIRLLIIILGFASSAYAQDDLREELIYRVASGSPQDIRFLIEHATNLNIADDAGWPLVSIAASRADGKALEVVKLLYEAGADLSYDGGRKNYPLFIAVQSGNADVVTFLLENGADYRIRDVYGMTLSDFSLHTGNTEVIKEVSKAVNRDKAAYRDSRSPEAFAYHFHQLAFNTCSHQYMAYYYLSKQDDIPKAKQDVVLERFQKATGKNTGHLRQKFKLDNDLISAVVVRVSKDISHELDNLVSNRWRRQSGVGSDEDRVKRCKALSEAYEGLTIEEAYALKLR